MGIYVFNANILERRLEGRPEKPRNDFGKDIIPAMISAADRVYAYRYEGYWVDVGTVDSTGPPASNCSTQPRTGSL